MNSIKKEITRLIKAVGYSIDGIIATLKTEPAFKWELLLTIILVPVACMMEVIVESKILMISSLFIILIAELMNTGIECAIDRISTEKHPLAKKAKDVGSAIVMLALINAAITWIMVIIY